MIKNIIFSCLIIFPFFAFGQSSNNTKHDIRQAAQFFENEHDASVQTFIDDNIQTFGLETSDDLKSSRVFETNNWKRHRFTQAYQGLEVLGSAYIIHEKNGKVIRSTGDLLPNIKLDINPDLSQASAIGILKDHVIFQESKHEVDIDPENIEIESIERKIMDQSYPGFSGRYILIYEILAKYDGEEHQHFQYLMDANTGVILDQYTKIHKCGGGAKGTAKTHYYGEQDIETQAVEANGETDAHFVLYDETRNIATVDYSQRNSEADFGYELFKDEDNYWDNFNAEKDEFAGDAHYCATAYYDYMDQHFDWLGVDGLGGAMITVVHAIRKFYVNAFWNGESIFIGNGDCANYGPLTTLTVVGHEYAHGFTEFSSGLIYRNESGALNESISDIIGKAIEYEYDPEGFSWDIGHLILTSDNVTPFRSMSDPNVKNDPKFYRGESWYTGSGDNGGVHSNSGVYNYWCYLLVEGVSGVNEVGYEFDVPSIGFEKVADIVYGAQVAYFTPDTKYTDAYIGTLQYVEDIYGLNSTEYAAVDEAWKAVGVSSEFSLVQVSGEILIQGILNTICLNECIDIPIQIVNTGFDDLPAGTSFFVQYEVDNNVEAVENFTIGNNFAVGDTIMYTFQSNICHLDPNDIGDQDHIEVFVSINGEDNFVEIDQFFLNHQTDLGKDLVLDTLYLTPNVCFPGYYTARAYVNISGCESLPEETPLALRFTNESGNSFTHQFFNSSSISPTTGRYDNIAFDIEWPLEQSMPFTAELIYDEDPALSNNIEESVFQSFQVMLEDRIETFDDYQANDSEFIHVDLGIRSFNAPVNYQGENYLAIGSYSSGYSTLPCEDPQDVFYNFSNSYKSYIELCFDATNIEDPVLRFDMIPFYSNNVDGLQADISSMVQVLMPGDDDDLVEAMTGMPEGVKEVHEFPITVQSGMIRIAVVNMIGNQNDFIAGILENSDIMLFDNIRIESQGSTSVDELAELDLVQVFPNPADDQVNFEFGQSVSQLKIYSIDGKVALNVPVINDSFVWEVPQFLKGMLIYEATDREGNKQVGKLMIH